MTTLSRDWMILAMAIGIAGGLLILWIEAKMHFIDPSKFVARTILWGQMVTIIAMWPARGQDGSIPFIQRSYERFEFGWIIIMCMCLFLAASLWNDRHRPSAPLALMVIGLTGVMFAQFVSWNTAGFTLPMVSFVPMVVVAICLAYFPLRFDEAVKVLATVMMVLCVVSVAAMVSGAQWSMPVEEIRTLPGPKGNKSLGGLMGHPNQLGPLATLGLALVIPNWQRIYALFLPIFCVTLWLTDSRTQVVATFLVFVVWGVQRMRKRLGWRVALWISTGVILLTSAGVVLFELNRGSYVDKPLVGMAERPDLWVKAIDYWRSSKLVGVGPLAFDDGWVTPQGRKVLGAHNEVMQTLAAEGLLGLFWLAILLAALVLAICALKDRTKTTLLLVGVAGLALISAETPLRPQQSITGLGLLLVSTVFALVAASSSAPELESSVGRRLITEQQPQAE